VGGHLGTCTPSVWERLHRELMELNPSAARHIERWVGSGLLVAERLFRKAQGYREIP